MAAHFDRLKSIVLEARELEGAARAAFLAAACGEDDELRLEAESLLAHAQDAVPVLSTAAAVRFVDPDALALEREPDEEAQPEAVGPYRIRRILGQGGMGTVYEAEQVKPISRVVALKLIRRGLDTDAVIARFMAERQALALMDHPAIARVLDAGASLDGRPYFVMELVTGVPITEYCRDRKLGIRQVLQLFLAVCQGVRHAHQKGIVHRDLKPSNVLVRETDGVAMPKIIDFGIAKAIDASASQAALEPATRIGGAIGTPDYMSPEQAGVIPGGVDTRTDVYSLGVLLYEILTARRPYSFSAYTPGEIHRVLRGPDPPPPSVAAPDRRRQLAGDLDNIVAKAIAREPANRYPSVEQFADDIRRHLDGEPVVAREATWSYRAAKFGRRHTGAVAVAATLTVLVVGAGVTFAIQAARLAAERDRARSAEQLARAQAATAESVVSFLVDLFQTSDPSEARGNTVTAREILDRGAQRIESDLRETPQVQATLLGTMGRVYQNLGLYGVAQPLLERALERRREVFGPAHGAVGESLDHLALLRRKRGDHAGAEPLFRQALAIKRRTQGPDHPSIAETMANLSYVLRNSDRMSEAEALAREALAMRLRLFGPEHHDVAEGLHEVGATLWRRGDLAGAEEHLRRAVDLDRRLLGELHPVMAIRWHTLGQVLSASGKLEAAEEALRRSLDLNRILHGSEHPDFAHASSGLAWLLIDAGKLDEAGPLLERALDLHRRLVGEENRWVVADLQGLGLLELRAGDYTRAERMFRRALTVATRILGPESALAAEATMNLGSALRRQGRIAEAEPMLRRAEAVWVRTLGPTHPDYGRYVWELASAVAARGGVDEAEKLFRQALDIRRKTLPARDPEIATALASLGTLLLNRGAPGPAEPLLREAVDIYREALPASDHTRREAERALARCQAAPRPS
jgi:tetratricopeptide (TPR) repeat protein